MATQVTITGSQAQSLVPAKQRIGVNIAGGQVALGGAATTSGDSGTLQMLVCKVPANSRIVGVNAYLGQVTNGVYQVVVDAATLATACVGAFISSVNVSAADLETTNSHSQGFVYAWLRCIPGSDTTSVVGHLTIFYEHKHT